MQTVDDALCQALLEKELQRLEDELRLLEPALQIYESDSMEEQCVSHVEVPGGLSSQDVGVHLEDLPMERLCLFLPAVSLVALMMSSPGANGRVDALLATLAGRLKQPGSSGLPLLLPLLKFFHGLQAPKLALSTKTHVSLGSALMRMPAACVGSVGEERWCPLRLAAAPSNLQWRGAAGTSHTCTIGLGGHVTPRILKVELYCSEPEAVRGERRQSREVSLSLVDTSAPKQPLFSLTLECNSFTWPTLRATVREVISCQGRGAWAYRQRPWAFQTGHHHLMEPRQDANGVWLQLHFEFDWDTSLCAAMDESDERIEGPLQLEWRPEFGVEPTANTLNIHVAPGSDVSLATLLVG